MKKFLFLILIFSQSIFCNAQISHNNLIQVSVSGLTFSRVNMNPYKYSYHHLMLYGINYNRGLTENTSLNFSLNFWNSDNLRSSNYLNYSLNKTDSISTEFERTRYKYFDVLFDYKLKTLIKGNHNLIIGSGISGVLGINNIEKALRHWPPGRDSLISFISKKEFYIGPVFKVEYNINPFKNRFNLGVHAIARYYKELRLEFDYGIHTGVNF